MTNALQKQTQEQKLSLIMSSSIVIAQSMFILQRYFCYRNLKPVTQDVNSDR